MAFRSGNLNPKYQHGHTQGGRTSSTYYRWGAMIQRCTNPRNRHYRYYGARGISVCDRWLTFKNFVDDMGTPPPGGVLDRIDNDRGYEPGNCRWTTTSVSAINRRMAVPITHNGRTMCISEWAAELGMTYSTLYARIFRGYSEERIFRPLNT